MDYNVLSDIECDFPTDLTNLNNKINKVSIQFSRLKLDSEKSKDSNLEKQKTKRQLSPFDGKGRSPLKRKSRSPSNEKSYRPIKKLKPRQISPNIPPVNYNHNFHKTITIKNYL